MNCCLAQLKLIHLKIPIGVNIKMLARSTANAGFPVMMQQRASLCTRCFACKAHHRLLLRNKNVAYIAKPLVGVLRRNNKPLLSNLLPKKHPLPPIKTKSQQPKPLAVLSLLPQRFRYCSYTHNTICSLVPYRLRGQGEAALSLQIGIAVYALQTRTVACTNIRDRSSASRNREGSVGSGCHSAHVHSR